MIWIKKIFHALIYTVAGILGCLCAFFLTVHFVPSAISESKDKTVAETQKPPTKKPPTAKANEPIADPVAANPIADPVAANPIADPVAANPNDPAAAPVSDPVAANPNDPAVAPVSDPVAANPNDPAAAPVSDPVAANPNDPAVAPVSDPVAANPNDPAVAPVSDPVAANPTGANPNDLVAPPTANINDPAVTDLNTASDEDDEDINQVLIEIQTYMAPYIYDFKDRKNPFEDPTTKIGIRTEEKIKTPPEEYSLDEIRLKGIIWDTTSPRAMFKLPNKDDFYTLSRGSRIGKNGTIFEIREDEVVIVESVLSRGSENSQTQIKILKLDRLGL